MTTNTDQPNITPCDQWLTNDAGLASHVHTHRHRHQILPNVNQETLLSLYQRANIVSFLTPREEFGLPIFEAQDIGACSRDEQYWTYDIAGYGACYINHADAMSIRQGILTVWQNST